MRTALHHSPINIDENHVGISVFVSNSAQMKKARFFSEWKFFKIEKNSLAVQLLFQYRQSINNIVIDR